MRYTRLLFTISLLLFITILTSQENELFHGYAKETFNFQGHKAIVVSPSSPNESKQWIWRARFWGVEPQVDKALLEKGYHVVYVDVSGLYGNSEAVQIWNRFYDHIRLKYNLNDKVVLEGLSRGGLIIYNWAAENTDKVACIYADAPVCNIRSWPGGLYTGVGSPKSWVDCLSVYGLNEETVLNFVGNPIDNAVVLAKAKIPVIHVYGDQDEVVPHFENTELLAIAMVKEKGIVKLIRKEGVGHHPHSLKEPSPIVNFILEHSLFREENK